MPDIACVIGPQPVRIAAAFETLPDSMRLTSFVERLRGSLHGCTNVLADFWKLDLFSGLQMRVDAGMAASAADAIIIATHGNGGFPELPAAFIYDWITGHGRKGAILLSMDDSTNGSSAIRNYLKHLAREADMQFVWDPDKAHSLLRAKGKARRENLLVKSKSCHVENHTLHEPWKMPPQYALGACETPGISQ